MPSDTRGARTRREDLAPLRRGPHLDEGEAASPARLLGGLKGTSSDSFLF